MPSREDRKQRITRERQEQIMEAALNVFSRRGYAGATMPEIAREAGVAVGTIYNYFPSKRELLVAIADSYIIDPFRAIVQQQKGSDLEFLAAIMENRLNLGLQDMGRFLALFNEIQRDPDLRKRYAEEALTPIMTKLEEYVMARTADGVFREVDPAMAVRAVGGMFIGFMLIVRMEGDKTPVDLNDRQKLAQEMAKLVLRGVMNK